MGKDSPLSRYLDGDRLRKRLARVAELSRELNEQIRSEKYNSMAAEPKHVVLELSGGKYDGLILDSNSGDPTERELLKFLRYCVEFDTVQKVETEREVWIQLRFRDK